MKTFGLIFKKCQITSKKCEIGIKNYFIQDEFFEISFLVVYEIFEN